MAQTLSFLHRSVVLAVPRCYLTSCDTLCAALLSVFFAADPKFAHVLLATRNDQITDHSEWVERLNYRRRKTETHKKEGIRADTKCGLDTLVRRYGWEICENLISEKVNQSDRARMYALTFLAQVQYVNVTWRIFS